MIGSSSARLYRPVGLQSIPRDIVRTKKYLHFYLFFVFLKVFDIVIILGKNVPEISIASKQTLNWSGDLLMYSLNEEKEIIDKKVRELLLTLK